MLKVLTEKQIERLLNTPDWRSHKGKRDRALLAILAYGGLRISEACSLKRDNIEQVGDRLRLTFTGKGGHTRTVTLPRKAAPWVIAYLATHTSPFIFPGQQGALSSRTGHRIVVGHAEAAGLPDWIHPHSLRHTYGSTVMRKTHDLFLVSRVMGHRNTQTTAQYYLSFDPRYADEAAEVFE